MYRGERQQTDRAKIETRSKARKKKQRVEEETMHSQPSIHPPTHTGPHPFPHPPMTTRRPFPGEDWPAALRGRASPDDSGFQLCQVCGKGATKGKKKGTMKWVLSTKKSEAFMDLQPWGNDDLEALCAGAWEVRVQFGGLLGQGAWEGPWESREDLQNKAKKRKVTN